MKENGKMKDESGGKIIIDLVWLKSKMYSLIYVDGKEYKKGKGAKSVVVENKIETYEVSKISLPCFVDKRYILHGSINSLFYFHKDVRGQ